MTARTDRDFLDVGTWSRSWTVYGLMCPVTKAVFYVGITNRTIPERLNQHRTDRASAVWDVIQEIEQRDGNKVEFCDFALVRSEAAARHLESALIAILPQIFNRTQGREGVGFWRAFVSDCELLGDKVMNVLASS